MAEEDRELGLIGRARLRLAEVAAGEDTALVAGEDLELLEAQAKERRILGRELEDLAYASLDYFGGNQQDMTAVARRKLVQQARVAWQADPQIGAAVDLYNDFTLGRGVPKPKARDPEVQKVLDEAWEDDDNELVLTAYEAQMTLSTDLTLQSNLFVLAFMEGDDGKVKLSMLDHDAVEQIVPDKENRRRHLWYIARERTQEWDYRNHTTKPIQNLKEEDRIKYYAHWENDAPEGQKPEDKWIGKGRVYHVAINKTGEMFFGHPIMHRVLRWSSAFNSLMEARVDLARAAAAFIMKRKVKGTRNQVEKSATQALSRRSQLGRSVDIDTGAEEVQGPKAGSILNENEGIEHETFSLDSQAQNANTDGQMIRSQISAATHFPQHYLGDIGSANLAIGTAMELPVLKAIESRQEIVEGIFRWFCDLVIERAIKSGRLKKKLTDEEMAEKEKDQDQEGTEDAPPPPTTETEEPVGAGATTTTEEAEGEKTGKASLDLDTGAATEDEDEEDEERMRDLSYDFSLPSPLRRMLGDLVTAVGDIARTFDPNGTNLELSRTLLAVVLGEGLEMADPGEVVEKVFPPGYKDPAMAALEQQPPPGGGGEGDKEENPFGSELSTSNGNGNGEGDYGAPTAATPPEQVREARAEALRADLELRARGGIPLEEAIMDRITHPGVRKAIEERMSRAGRDFDKATKPLRELVAKGDGDDKA